MFVCVCVFWRETQKLRTQEISQEPLFQPIWFTLFTLINLKFPCSQTEIALNPVPLHHQHQSHRHLKTVCVCVLKGSPKIENSRNKSGTAISAHMIQNLFTLFTLINLKFPCSQTEIAPNPVPLHHQHQPHRHLKTVCVCVLKGNPKIENSRNKSGTAISAHMIYPFHTN